MSRFHHLVLIVGSCHLGVNYCARVILHPFWDVVAWLGAQTPRVTIRCSLYAWKSVGKKGLGLEMGGQVAKIGLERPFVLSAR
jgi:hypothetical protein